MIDGTEVLAAPNPTVETRADRALRAQGDAVFFDDLHVAADRESLVVAHTVPEARTEQHLALEDDMEQWAKPTLEWDRDIKTGVDSHRLFPGEQTIVLTSRALTNCARFCSLQNIRSRQVP